MVFPIGLSPNLEYDDVLKAWLVLFSPWRWYKTDGRKQVLRWFQERYHQHVSLFISGRSSLTALLQAFGIGTGDEVIMQAFTCMVVPNAIRFAGATPRFVDIDNTANIAPHLLEKAITGRTRAIIVQHTFGTPADMDAIVPIARKHGCIIIEDCAHALGARYKDALVGTFGDAAFFSFGRDKCVSSVFGGAAIVKDKSIAKKLDTIETAIPYPSRTWILQQLFHPIATAVILPLYFLGIGKLLLVMLQKAKLLSFPVLKQEIAGREPRTYLCRFPNALAILLFCQLQKLDRYMQKRQRIARYFEKELKSNTTVRLLSTRKGSGHLRFPLRVSNQRPVLAKAKQNGLILGNWYHNVIDPVGSDRKIAGYAEGSCKNAEALAKEIINLPTRISEKQAGDIVRFFSSL